MSSMSQAALVDLSSWTAEGAGRWTLQSGNDTVYQSINGDPTVFFSGINSQGLSLSGEITVRTTSDDDYIGFVLGYNAGDFNNPNADYLLIDWKQNNQPYFGGTAAAGLAISRITDVMDLPTFWRHEATPGFEELQRGTTLGSTGWNDYTTYSFDLIFTSSLVQVFVDDELELNVSGNFANGSFGFYNYSQSDVLYAGITEDTVPTPTNVNEPTTFGIIALSSLGLLGFRRRR
ncbi:hypothetical protein [Alteromonas sp.]|uniref:hypothetical protein n=1 Tax=Alteromonas sp. TaxID=232 RepID=UPI00257E15DF|nr:hypothetical protein [Alteromonas sp.]NQY17684.1 PEP-CTERM sorting domain-containing protein [Alteromonas sp.]